MFEELVSSHHHNTPYALDQDESKDAIDILRERLLKAKPSSAVERALEVMASRSCTPTVASKLVAPIVVISSPQESPEDWSEDFILDDSVRVCRMSPFLHLIDIQIQVNNDNGVHYNGSPVELMDVDHHHLSVPSSAPTLEKQTPLSFDAVYDLAVSRVMTRSVSGLGIVIDQLESSCPSPEPSYPLPQSSFLDLEPSSPKPEPSHPSPSPSNPDLTMVNALEDEPRLCSADLDILASPFELATPMLSANAPALVVQPQSSDVTATVTVHEQMAEQVDTPQDQVLKKPLKCGSYKSLLSNGPMPLSEFLNALYARSRPVATSPSAEPSHESFVPEQLSLSSPSTRICVTASTLVRPLLAPTVLQDVISPIDALSTPRLATMHHPMITQVETADIAQSDMTPTNRRLTTQEAEKLCSRIQALQQAQQPQQDLDSPRAAALLFSPALDSDSPLWVNRSVDGLGLGLLPSSLSSGDEDTPVPEFVYDTQPHPAFELTLPHQGPSSFREVSGFFEEDETAESPASSDDTPTGPNSTNDTSPEEEQESPLPITFLTLTRFPKRPLYNIVEVDTPPPSPPVQPRGSLRRPVACSNVSNKTKSLQPLLSLINAPGHSATSYTPLTNGC